MLWQTLYTVAYSTPFDSARVPIPTFNTMAASLHATFVATVTVTGMSSHERQGAHCSYTVSTIRYASSDLPMNYRVRTGARIHQTGECFVKHGTAWCRA
jgi:hypothetical protein